MPLTNATRLITCGLAGLALHCARAAESAAPSVDEVVVTAQKRQQDIGEVGMSIAAFSGATLRERGIESIEDLARIVPGLTYTLTPAGPPVLTLRGVGFYDSTLAAAPAVSVYVDEAPLAMTSFSQVPVIDVERVEVLKGPQGTLYGENSTGGAINYIAAKPTIDRRAGASLSFSRFSTAQATGFLSGPVSDALGDTLKFRLAAQSTRGEEWQHSFTRDESLGVIQRTAARALLQWEPAPGTTVTVNVNGWRDTSDAQAFQFQATECTLHSNCAPELLAYVKAPDDARAADWTPGFPMSFDDRFFQSTLRADVQLGASLSLTSISGYQQFDQDKFMDDDATRIEAFDVRQEGHAESFNQELRLSGTAGRASWLAGTYFTRANVRETQAVGVSRISVNEPFPGLIPAATTGGGRFDQDLRSYAAFTDVDWRITHALSAVAGMRYTEARRDFAGCSTSGADPSIGLAFALIGAATRGELPSVPPVPANGCISLDKVTFRQGLTQDRLTEHNLSFRLGLDYKLDGALLYANISRGYKSGSFPTVSASTSAQYMPVTQESVLAYQAGVKAPLWQQRVEIDAAAFLYDYDDKQIRGRIVDPVFGALETLVNVPRSRLWGVEASMNARPLRGLSISAAAAYTHSEVQEFIGITAMGAMESFAGSSFPYAPQWQAAANARYDWTLSADYRGFVGLGCSYQDSTHAALGEDPNFRLKPYAVADAQAGIETIDGRWQLSMYGRNMGDAYYWNNVFQFIDTRLRIAGRPATYGVKADFNF